MQRAFDLIKEKLREKAMAENEPVYTGDVITDLYFELNNALDAVDEVASEYGGGWIPVSSGVMPEERQSILAKFKGTDKWNDAMFEKISDEVNVTVVSEKGNAATTHAHTKDGKWSCDLLEVYKTYRVIAWQPLPEPYKAESEE